MRKLTKLNELWLKNNPLPRCFQRTTLIILLLTSASSLFLSIPFRPADFPMLHVLLIDLTTAMPQ
jgi:hypothetical protein